MEPSELSANLQASYDLTPRLTLTMQAVNLYNQCFQRGYAWDNSVTCVYSTLPSNILAPSGNFVKNPPPQLRYPYGTFFNVTEVGISSVRQPFGFFADLSIKLPGVMVNGGAKQRRRTTRAAFLSGTGASLLSAAAIPRFSWAASSGASGRERIAIVGAGIAGLVAAMRLRDAGIAATVYESSARIGGRMHSERSYWDAGQHTEWCGAMVDSTHVNIHRLAHRFHQGLLNTYAGRPPRARDTCFLDGRYYTMAQADRDFARIYPILQDQLGKVAANTTYANATPTARRLDAISMRDWIARYVPGGLESQLGRLIAESYRNEYGREIGELSALNLVAQLGSQRRSRPKPRDERARILRPAVHLGQRKPIAPRSDCRPATTPAALCWSAACSRSACRPGGSYELRFDHRGAREAIYADRVILALPFIALRAVDYASAGFDSAKANAIENLGYGYHTKLHLQFDRRAWMRASIIPGPSRRRVRFGRRSTCRARSIFRSDNAASRVSSKFLPPPIRR